MSNLLE